MVQRNMPKWQRQVEGILRRKFQGDELEQKIAKVSQLVRLAHEVEIPTGETGEVVAMMLRWASHDLRPLSATYAGFQLGVAYERYQNANRA